jgi:hypothetical protein
MVWQMIDDRCSLEQPPRRSKISEKTGTLCRNQGLEGNLVGVGRFRGLPDSEGHGGRCVWEVNSRGIVRGFL